MIIFKSVKEAHTGVDGTEGPFSVAWADDGCGSRENDCEENKSERFHF